MAKVATGVKHKIGAFWEAAAAGTPDIGVMLLISAGLEDENVLADRDTVAAILAATSDEATFTNYTRKTVSPTTTRDDAADSVTLTLAGAPPLIIDWPAAGGAGGLGTNNVLGRVVFFYDPTPGSSTDAQKLHLASMPITATTDGSTVRVTIPPSGIATYRDGAGAQSVSTSSTPGDGTVSDATVATGAGISLDKTADSATRLAMTAAERTKLGTLASGGVTPDGSVTNAKVATGAAVDLDKTADSATRLAMTAAERTKLGTVATGADNSAEVDVQSFTANGTFTKPTGGQTMCTMDLIGGGGGGGAGARRASGTLSTGGSGGSGGATTRITVPLSALGATEAIVVGAAGVGAAPTTTNDTNGAAGTAGGNTTVGGRYRAGGGGGGGGGTSTGASAVGSTGTGSHNGGTGATSSATGGGGSQGNSGAAGGGGSGGGIATTPANTAGGAGVSPSTVTGITQGAAGASGGGAGGNGATTVPTSVPVGGPSGGGGGSSTTAAGGVGGNAAGYGAGGGGGGAALNGQNGGGGGTPTAGFCQMTCW